MQPCASVMGMGEGSEGCSPEKKVPLGSGEREVVSAHLQRTELSLTMLMPACHCRPATAFLSTPQPPFPASGSN